VLVSGTIRSNVAPGTPEPEGEAQIPLEVIAREIQPLEGMREASAREVRLFVMLSETLDDTLKRVRKLLEDSPGSIPVTLEVRRPGQYEARIQPSPRYAVRPSVELTNGLKQLLGDTAVRLV
jgi:hypothetical protein